MTRFPTPILISCSAVLLLGCAAPQQTPLDMQPVLRLQHGGGQGAANWYRLGKYHQERGELSLAMGAYAQSLALDSRQLDARMAVAAIDARQGRLAAARDALQALVADYPAQAQLSNNLGYVYYLMGDQQSAIAMLRRALALDAASVRAQDNLRLAEAAALTGAASAGLAAGGAVPASPAAGPVANPAISPAAADPDAGLPPPTRAELRQLQEQLRVLQERSAAAGIAPAQPVVAAAAPVVAAAGAAPVASSPSFAPATTAVAAEADPRPATAAVLVAAPASAPVPESTVTPAPAHTTAAVLAAAPASKPVPESTITPAPAPAHITAAILAAAPASKPDPESTPTPAPARTSAAVMAQVDIANGNGVLGLAKRFRRALAQIGIPVGRVSNERPYRQQTTTIEYRAGYQQQAAALQATLLGQAALLPAGPHAQANLRLVLGKDMRVQPALAAQAPGAPLLAAADAN
jgi:tetratricopeptide (TPR) repeat protein